MGLAETAIRLTVPTSRLHGRRYRKLSPRPKTPSGEQARRQFRLCGLAAVSGVIVGFASWAFLESLNWATRTRLSHDAILWFLPLAGLAVGLAYHHLGGRSSEGTGLLLKEIHEPTAWVPRRLAPLVAIASVVSHLFGASVGREGAALQISGSLSDLVNRTFRVDREDRRVLLIAALGGGFGAVFIAPWAGFVFGLEVQWVRRIRLRGVIRWCVDHLRRSGEPAPSAEDRDDVDTRPVPGDDLAEPGPGRVGRDAPNARLLAAVLPTLIASGVGATVVRLLGFDEHPPVPDVGPISPGFVARALLVGVAAGITAYLFVGLTEGIRHRMSRHVSVAPLRPVIGGVVTLGLAAVVGKQYLGLSLPLVHDALTGGITSLADPGWKLAFTALCLGTGFVGGEVTPMFVMGATVGGAVGSMVGLDPAAGAAVGYAAVFAGAANAPIACTVMAVEVFGPHMFLPAAAACVASFFASGRWGVYHHRPEPESSGATVGPT